MDGSTFLSLQLRVYEDDYHKTQVVLANVEGAANQVEKILRYATGSCLLL